MMKKKGFTLIELMIVIAIIAILAAILVPNFLKARAQGVATACSANLKNIATAVEMYSTDNNGSYPTGLDKLTPTYLQALPSCSAGGNYGYSSSLAQSYTIYCTVTNAHTAAGYGTTGFPQYTATGGLKKN